MPTPPKITQATLDRIAELREADATYEAIGAAVGLSASHVNSICLKRGFERSVPSAELLWTDIRGPAVTRRGNHEVRRFTEQEDAELLALEAEGLSYTAIARRLGRARTSIENRLITLARREARKEAA